MPKIFDNLYPCGDRKHRKLESRLAHYKTCQHAECLAKGARLILSLTEGKFLPDLETSS